MKGVVFLLGFCLVWSWYGGSKHTTNLVIKRVTNVIIRAESSQQGTRLYCEYTMSDHSREWKYLGTYQRPIPFNEIFENRC